MAIHHSLIYLIACALTIVSFARGDMPAETPRSTEVFLHFMHADELKLVAERRIISQAANTVEQIRSTAVELIKGPATALMPTIPEETVLREVFLDEKGCAYVDFSRDISEKHPGGTTGELVTVASIVNTLTANFPEEIQKVQILIGGKEAETIAGHIDISRPIFPFEFE